MIGCVLAMLAQKRKCKKVIVWSGNFGIDQYVSWNLTNEELPLGVIWGGNLKNSVNTSLMKSEQDLTCLQALDKVIEVWMNSTMR